MATTVEHVKQLRDDITVSTQQSIRDTFRDSEKVADDRAARLEMRMNSLETHLAKITAMLEGNGGTTTYPPPATALSSAYLPPATTLSSVGAVGGSGSIRSSGGMGAIVGSSTASARGRSTPSTNGTMSMSNSRSVNSHLGSSNHHSGE